MDNNRNIRINVDGKNVLAKKGALLSNVINIAQPCGGNGTCGKCKVKVDGKEVLACKYRVVEDIAVETYEKGKILSETGAVEEGNITENMCFALDIGTTTLALALVSLDEKKTVKVITETNPQNCYGADVISRINYCAKNSVNALQRVLVAQINRMISEFHVKEIENMYVSGNATMLHIFFGVDCSSIGVAPYRAAFLDKKLLSADALGIRGVKIVESLPSVSAFVGADIVAGLYYIGMPDRDKYNLLIDLGTNAEVVLYSESGGFATAAAAGPCFEGANISSGMSATDGAVYAFEISDGKAIYKTVSDALPVGICGTGLVDIISELLKVGIIDETGYMKNSYPINERVSLSAEDVRQYQLAKSAIYSAILALMKKCEVRFSDISKMYISGGFSSKINIGNAVYSGLLPKELAFKATALNNSSLLGTVKYAILGGDIDKFSKNIEYVDLSKDAYFTGSFIENMVFEIE